MNIKLFFCCLLLLLGSVGVAQERAMGAIEIIPNIGATGSNIYGEDVEDTDNRYGFQGGVLVEYYLNSRWSLRSGLSYFNMGAQDDYIELKLDYVNIPLNANWHFGSTRKWNLNFGFTPGFLVKADSEGIDVKEMFQSFQLGFSYGIGYKLEISQNFCLLIDYQGVVGLTNIIDESDVSDAMNTGSSINLGAVFVL